MWGGAKERYEIAKNALSPNDSRDIVTYLNDLVNEIGIPDLKDSVKKQSLIEVFLIWLMKL